MKKIIFILLLIVLITFPQMIDAKIIQADLFVGDEARIDSVRVEGLLYLPFGPAIEGVSQDGTLADSTHTYIVTMQAIKQYVDSQTGGGGYTVTWDDIVGIPDSVKEGGYSDAQTIAAIQEALLDSLRTTKMKVDTVVITGILTDELTSTEDALATAKVVKQYIDNYSQELAEDGVGTMLSSANTPGNIVFTYKGAEDSLYANTVDSLIDHNRLMNYSADKHIDHTTVTVIGGYMMDGGGSIASNRIISFKGDAAILPTASSSEDYFLVYDNSADSTKRVLISTLLSAESEYTDESILSLVSEHMDSTASEGDVRLKYDGSKFYAEVIPDSIPLDSLLAQDPSKQYGMSLELYEWLTSGEAQVDKLQKDGTPEFTGLSARDERITNVALPTDSLDAANKKYVDSLAEMYGAETIASDGVIQADEIEDDAITSLQIADNINISNILDPVSNQDVATKHYVDTLMTDHDNPWSTISGRPTHLDIDSTDDFSGEWHDLTNIPTTLDVNSDNYVLKSALADSINNHLDSVLVDSAMIAEIVANTSLDSLYPNLDTNRTDDLVKSDTTSLLATQSQVEGLNEIFLQQSKVRDSVTAVLADSGVASVDSAFVNALFEDDLGTDDVRPDDYYDSRFVQKSDVRDSVGAIAQDSVDADFVNALFSGNDLTVDNVTTSLPWDSITSKPTFTSAEGFDSRVNSIIDTGVVVTTESDTMDLISNNSFTDGLTGWSHRTDVTTSDSGRTDSYCMLFLTNGQSKAIYDLVDAVSGVTYMISFWARAAGPTTSPLHLRYSDPYSPELGVYNAEITFDFDLDTVWTRYDTTYTDNDAGQNAGQPYPSLQFYTDSGQDQEFYIDDVHYEYTRTNLIGTIAKDSINTVVDSVFIDRLFADDIGRDSVVTDWDKLTEVPNIYRDSTNILAYVGDNLSTMTTILNLQTEIDLKMDSTYADTTFVSTSDSLNWDLIAGKPAYVETDAALEEAVGAIVSDSLGEWTIDDTLTLSDIETADEETRTSANAYTDSVVANLEGGARVAVAGTTSTYTTQNTKEMVLVETDAGELGFNYYTITLDTTVAGVGDYTVLDVGGNASTREIRIFPTNSEDKISGQDSLVLNINYESARIIEHNSNFFLVD